MSYTINCSRLENNIIRNLSLSIIYIKLFKLNYIFLSLINYFRTIQIPGFIGRFIYSIFGYFSLILNIVK